MSKAFWTNCPMTKCIGQSARNCPTHWTNCPQLKCLEDFGSYIVHQTKLSVQLIGQTVQSQILPNVKQKFTSMHICRIFGKIQHMRFIGQFLLEKILV